MMNSIRLSIIVPIYNVEQYLEGCVSSLFNQDISPSEYEIILVNDGSTDGSYNLAKQISRNKGNIVLISQGNGGQGKARNHGLDVARGNYVMFVDSDDELYPNILGQLLDTAENNCLDVVESRMMVQEQDGSKHMDFIQPFASNEVLSGEYALLNHVQIGSVCTNMYAREFLNVNDLRFTSDIFHEDVEFNLKMYAFAKRIMFTDILSYYYRYNPVSTDREKSSKKIIKDYRSDFQIAENITVFSNSSFISPELKLFYQRHKNSTIISCLISLMRRRDLNKGTKISLFEELKKTGVYPLRGRTLSWKTTLLKYPFNCKWLYERFLN